MLSSKSKQWLFDQDSHTVCTHCNGKGSTSNKVSGQVWDCIRCKNTGIVKKITFRPIRGISIDSVTLDEFAHYSYKEATKFRSLNAKQRS